MGILDEAIREHLELKRQHGAGDSELKQLEDEAFGPPERPGSGEEAPDAAAEAPTQFMTQSDLPASEAAPKADQESQQRRESAGGILDLQEAPEATEAAEEEQPAAEHEAVIEADPGEPQPEEPQAEESQPEEPAAQEAPSEVEEEQDPAAVEQDPPEVEEDQPIARAEESGDPAGGHSTEERHAIAEQPTQHFDVEEEFSASGPAKNEPEDESTPDEEDDFFNEQRLSEELDQALETPREPEPDAEQEPEFEPVSEDREEPAAELEPEQSGEPAPEDAQSQSAGREGDVLEGTPDFLEETPEDDELWFEQKPPKDFDFDD